MAQASQPRETVLSFLDARSCVEQHAANLRTQDTEVVELLHSAGRVLATDILADRDFPPFPRATRDGYAVRAADVAKVPATLSVVGQVKAGDSFNQKVAAGECVEIMTGAPVPTGTDAVVMVEYTSVLVQESSGVLAPASSGNTVEINRSGVTGENMVAAGSEARAGQLLLPTGMRMDYAAIAVAAAVGAATVRVFQRPRVAILSTGDEIIELTELPGPSQIRNSNSYSLAAQVTAAGAEPIQLPIAPDEASKLRALMRQGLSADLLLLSGGVSMGKYDLVEQVLSEAEFASEFFFTGAMIQPGKPVVFGRGRAQRPGPGPSAASKHTYFLGLPGNPISTMVTFELFAKPLIEALSGAPVGGLKLAHARLKKDLKTKTGLTRFLPARLKTSQSTELAAEVELVKWQGSGDIVAAAQANCYLVVPPDRDHLNSGEVVTVLLR